MEILQGNASVCCALEDTAAFIDICNRVIRASTYSEAAHEDTAGEHESTSEINDAKQIHCYRCRISERVLRECGVGSVESSAVGLLRYCNVYIEDRNENPIQAFI